VVGIVLGVHVVEKADRLEQRIAEFLAVFYRHGSAPLASPFIALSPDTIKHNPREEQKKPPGSIPAARGEGTSVCLSL
jgi:hypothetical protein